MSMGRTTESIAEMNRAHDLDPLSISTNFSLGSRLYMAREYDQAIEQLRNTIDMDPGFVLPHLVLGQAYEQKKAYDQAITDYGAPWIFRRTVHQSSLPRANLCCIRENHRSKKSTGPI